MAVLFAFRSLSALCPGKAGKAESRSSRLSPGWVATTPLTPCPSCLCRCAGSLPPRLVLRAGSPVSSAECRVSATSPLPSSCAGVVGWGPPPPLPSAPPAATLGVFGGSGWVARPYPRIGDAAFRQAPKVRVPFSPVGRGHLCHHPPQRFPKYPGAGWKGRSVARWPRSQPAPTIPAAIPPATLRMPAGKPPAPRPHLLAEKSQRIQGGGEAPASAARAPVPPLCPSTRHPQPCAVATRLARSGRGGQENRPWLQPT